MPLRTSRCCVHVLVLNTFGIGIRVEFSERSSRHVLGRLLTWLGRVLLVIMYPHNRENERALNLVGRRVVPDPFAHRVTDSC